MILVDFSNVFVSTLMAQLGRHTNAEVDESMLRHMVLNVLRSNRKKFTDKYGEIVLCVDDRNYWRRDIFPYYKALRKQHRENSEIDWKMVFSTLDSIKRELSENFPYKFVQVERAEADDVIAGICMEYGQQLATGEPILILSSDKDMSQLQKFANVDQFDPVRKRWIKNSDPESGLFEHVVRGDKGDGIPSVLNADDSIVSGERQKPLTKKRLLEWQNDINKMDAETQRNFKRNQMLIDFNYIPSHILEEVVRQFKEQKPVGREKLFDFFVQHRLRNMMEVIGDF